MSHVLLALIITTLFWGVPSVLHALPLSTSHTPQSELDLSAKQWEDSAILKEAVNFLKRGERQQAKIKLAQFLKQSPNDPRGAELAGMIMMEEKNYPVAVMSFERALALKPNNPAALSKLGASLLLQDKKKEGEAILNKAIALRPGDPLAQRYLGWLEEGRGNANSAGSHYIAALQGGDLPAGRLTEIHLALGRVYSALGRNEQTVRLLAPYVSKSGSGEMAQAARFQLAFAYIELERGAEVLPLIQSLEKSLKPDNPELRFLKAYAELDSNPTDARGKLQALIKSNPAYAGRVRLLIARTYALEGKTALAVKELEGLAGQVEKGDLPEVLTALTAVHLSTGKAAIAVKVLEGYAKKYPDIPDITYLLAETKLQAGDAATAQTLLKRLISQYPNYAQAYALLGQIERSQNTFATAEANLRKAVALDSKLANAWISLAGVYVSRKELPKAEDALKQALESNPGNALLQYELASIYDAMERRQDANALYRTILGAYPTYLPALNNIAANLGEGGEIASAQQYAEKAYQIDKRNPTVQDTYGWILILNNNTNKGLPLIQQAALGSPSDPTVLYHLGAALIKAGKTAEGKPYLQRALASGLSESLRKKAKSLLN